MSADVELFSIELKGVGEFAIWGPESHPHPHASSATPALARTSVLQQARHTEVQVHVLGESIGDDRTVSSPPFLFEQTNYQFNLALNGDVGHEVQLLHGGRNLLAGRRRIGASGSFGLPVNFRSEVGYTDIELRVGDRRLFTIRLEVFPSKLDYRTDLLELRADLQMEVRALIFELHGRTFQTLRSVRRQRSKDIEWLAVLKDEFDRLIKALELIVKSPLERVKVDHSLDRSRRAVRTSAAVRDYLRRNASSCVPATTGHFRADGREWVAPRLPRLHKQLTPETPENRFVAVAVTKIRRRLKKLKREVADVGHQDRFASWSRFLIQADRNLRSIQSRSFLSELATDGVHAEPSLALHLTPGYREFYSSCLALETMLEVRGGPLELPEKNLATLYELWCFVALARILREELGLTPRPPTWLRITQRRVALELAKGKTSVMSMEKAGEECIRVIYNRYNSTPTGSCLPDNTLEIFKRGDRRPFRYIFDAKYRLKSDPGYVKVNHAPGPPEDAIYRMHAYRDQIVSELSAAELQTHPQATVWDLGYRQYVQQTIGAFVLYPYSGADASQNRYVQAIGKVGVGAVPFLPGRRNEVTELLRKIIAMSSDSVEDTAVELSTAEERQRIEWAHEYGLIAIVPTREQLDYILNHGIYHTPYDKHKKWGLRLKADFLLLLLSESKFPGEAGVRYQAAIRSVHFGERREIEPPPPVSSRGSNDDDTYLWFKLKKAGPLPTAIPYEGHPLRFAFTTRLAFAEATNVSELLLLREPERRFYRECRNAGLPVSVFDDSPGAEQVFDIGHLRLRFVVAVSDDIKVTVRFDPVQARFRFVGGGFTWHELMFRPKDCLDAIANAAENSNP